MTNTHEWCAPGIDSQTQHAQEQPVDDLPWWSTRMAGRKPVYIPDVAELAEDAAAEKAVFLAQGARSLLCLPMADRDSEGKLWGFVGFDVMRPDYRWTESDIGLLQLLVQVIGRTIRRLEIFAHLQDNEKALQRQARLQDLLMEISSTYISLPRELVDSVIETSLGNPGDFVGADRANLFSYDFARTVPATVTNGARRGSSPKSTSCRTCRTP
jgi:GAF domain-containing protein